MVQFILSTRPFDRGWRDVVFVSAVSKILQSLRNTWDSKLLPRSEWMLRDAPYLLIEFFSNLGGGLVWNVNGLWPLGRMVDNDEQKPVSQFRSRKWPQHVDANMFERYSPYVLLMSCTLFYVRPFT